jgi:hypothetical protein
MTKTILLLSGLIFLTVSCNQQDKKTDTQPTDNQQNSSSTNFNLSGKVYSFGSDVGMHNCDIVYTIGDVFNSIIFLNDSEFVEQSSSPGYMYLTKGNYSLNNNKLSLNYNSDALIGENEDLEKNEMTFKKEKRNDKIVYEGDICNNSLYFITKDSTDRYLAIDKYYSTADSYQETLQRDGYWQKLGLPVKQFKNNTDSVKVTRGYLK